MRRSNTSRRTCRGVMLRRSAASSIINSLSVIVPAPAMPPSFVVPPRPPAAVRGHEPPPTEPATAPLGRIAGADVGPGGDDDHGLVVLGPAPGVQGNAVAGPAPLGEGDPGPT